MSTLVTKRLINTEEYYKMAEVGMLKPDEKVELINGEIYTMAPVGSKHAAVVDFLIFKMIRSFSDTCIVRSQNPVSIDQWSEPEPDIAILKYRKDNYVEAHPNVADVLLIVEVSDTSYEFDCTVKKDIYATAGIPVYWVIDLNESCIEVYENPVQHRYRKKSVYFAGDQIPFQDHSFDVGEMLLVKWK